MKEKAKKNIKDFLKDIIALAFIAAIIFGGYKLFENYKTNQANTDEIYKIKTERNSKYNGYYSLTKLDENGNNTWDGLMLYVEKDKIVECSKNKYTSNEEIKRRIRKIIGDDNYEFNKEEPLEWQALVNLGIELDKLNLPTGVNGLSTRFDGVDGGSNNPGELHNIAFLGGFVCKDKVDFDRVTDVRTDYDYIKQCGILPGYDEESKEVWLSKVLSNEKSEYHEGYKLLKYNSFKDIMKKYGN